MITKAELMALLWQRIAEAGDQKRMAQKMEVNEAYLSDVLRDKKEPGEKILNALGFERVVMFRRKEVSNGSA